MIIVDFNNYLKKKGVRKMNAISSTTQSNIERTIGLTLDKLNEMTFDQQQEWVEQKTNRKILFSKEKKRGIVGRGNPLLARKKIRTIEDIDKKSKKYIGI